LLDLFAPERVDDATEDVEDENEEAVKRDELQKQGQDYTNLMIDKVQVQRINFLSGDITTSIKLLTPSASKKFFKFIKFTNFSDIDLYLSSAIYYPHLSNYVPGKNRRRGGKAKDGHVRP
jgi:hypothetical protein